MLLLASALTCLTANIYYEARSESISGQMAVAHVTMNRARHDSKNVCNVVLKPRQFSWTTDKVVKRNGKAYISWRNLPRNKLDRSAWILAVGIAKVVLSGVSHDYTYGSTFYHTKAVKPVWRNSMVLAATVGNHIFYKRG